MVVGILATQCENPSESHSLLDKYFKWKWSRLLIMQKKRNKRTFGSSKKALAMHKGEEANEQFKPEEGGE